MHVLVAGCGWLGRAVAASLRARGDRVTGILRRGANRSELEQLGLEVHLLDLADPRSAQAIPMDLDAVVACQAPAQGSVHAYRQTYVDATANLIAACLSRAVRSFVYTSSTGVFGQRDGGDVDETSAPAPDGEHASILAEAERVVLGAAERDRLPARIVRISGLYGPGRVAIIERVRSGALGLGPGDHVWMNFCHLDDAVQTIVAALDRGRPGAAYHATDSEPARRRDVVRWIASQLGIEPPAEAASARDGGRRGANRRILGERTREELGLRLLYPSFRDGLAPFLAGAKGTGFRLSPE